jgi:endogenous inhibitor of DNA gyrase (YacG/DUF329 family)
MTNELQCEHCGKIIEIIHRASFRNFCSDECMGICLGYHRPVGYIHTHDWKEKPN